LSVVGNDVLLSFSDEEIEFKTRAINYLIRKKPEDVRYNLDQNYLVVSDLYDSDLDIQAFARDLKKGGPELFNSTYQAPLDLCNTAADTVGFELFADSQGNIVFRPPEYNKTPLSLLLKLISLKSTEGVGYIPDFLNDLFLSRSELIKAQITIIELEILEQMTLLGEPLNKILGGRVGDTSLSLTTPDGGATWFLDETAMELTIKKGTLFNFEEQNALRNNTLDFRVSDFATLLINVRNNLYHLRGRTDKMMNPKDDKLIASTKDEINQSNLSSSTNASVTRLRIVNKLAKLISSRHLIGNAYIRLKENSKTFSVANGDVKTKRESLPIPSSAASQISGKNLFNELPVFPKFMERLIENDLTNEEGFRSGKRFIIMDDVIINMDLKVVTPEFNQVEVTGNQDYISGNTDGTLGGIAKALWAGATDFDSWRQFGLRKVQQIFRPDFVNSETQCAPYAIFKLQEERRRIHQGTVTIAGNEFYQVGDVVYINNRSMLYYVTSVSHSFDFGSGSFQTTLNVEYGRALGEYIPTTLDIIGKGLLSTQRKAFGNILANRTSAPASQTVLLDTLFLPEYNDVSVLTLGKTRNEFVNRDQNKSRVKNAIQKASARINRRAQGDVRIEVRTYYVSGLNDTFIKSRSIGRWVCSMLTGEITQPDNEDATGVKFDKKNVVFVPPIDINSSVRLSEREEKLRRFPSSQAWTSKRMYENGDGVGLPLNAVDIVFVTEKSKYGDQDPVKLQEDEESCS